MHSSPFISSPAQDTFTATEFVLESLPSQTSFDFKCQNKFKNQSNED